MFETEKEVFLLLSLAGVPKSAIDVSIHKNHIRISGERPKMLLPGSHAHYHHLELGNGPFERFIRIPVKVDEKGIEASYVDGLLTIKMKKKLQRPKKVQVKSQNK